MKRIYLDHNATTPLDPSVKEAIIESLEEFGNPSSLHWFGQRAAARLEEARAEVAEWLHADPHEIYFTSGATEANNLALLGAAETLQHKGRRIITTAIEHPSVRNPLLRLAERGFEIIHLAVGPGGRVEPEAAAEAFTDDTILVSIMAANNETGVIQPVPEIASLARERGILVHTDAVQVAGKHPLDLRAWPVDLLSLSAHKFYGPKGVGILYIRKGVRIAPQILGGGQEASMRSGTENIPGIAGLAAAARLARLHQQEWPSRLAALRDRLEALILQTVPEVTVNGDLHHRLPNTTNLSFADAEGEAMVLALDLKGVAVSTGSACSSRQPHHHSVLAAMGVSPRLADCALRFSLGKDNTEEEIETAARLTAETAARLRAVFQ